MCRAARHDGHPLTLPGADGHTLTLPRLDGI